MSSKRQLGDAEVFRLIPIIVAILIFFFSIAELPTVLIPLGKDEVPATVVSCSSFYRRRGTKYYVYVDYEYNGKVYRNVECQGTEYPAREGTEIVVYLTEKQPNVPMMTTATKYSIWFWGGTNVAMLVYGIWYFKKQKQKQQ